MGKNNSLDGDGGRIENSLQNVPGGKYTCLHQQYGCVDKYVFRKQKEYDCTLLQTAWFARMVQ